MIYELAISDAHSAIEIESYATMREGFVCQKTGENVIFRLTLPIFSFELSAAAAPGIKRETSSLRQVEINQLEK